MNDVSIDLNKIIEVKRGREENHIILVAQDPIHEKKIVNYDLYISAIAGHPFISISGGDMSYVGIGRIIKWGGLRVGNERPDEFLLIMGRSELIMRGTPDSINKINEYFKKSIEEHGFAEGLVSDSLVFIESYGPPHNYNLIQSFDMDKGQETYNKDIDFNSFTFRVRWLLSNILHFYHNKKDVAYEFGICREGNCKTTVVYLNNSFDLESKLGMKYIDKTSIVQIPKFFSFVVRNLDDMFVSLYEREGEARFEQGRWKGMDKLKIEFSGWDNRKENIRLLKRKNAEFIGFVIESTVEGSMIMRVSGFMDNPHFIESKNSDDDPVLVFGKFEDIVSHFTVPKVGVYIVGDRRHTEKFRSDLVEPVSKFFLDVRGEKTSVGKMKVEVLVDDFEVNKKYPRGEIVRKTPSRAVKSDLFFDRDLLGRLRCVIFLAGVTMSFSVEDVERDLVIGNVERKEKESILKISSAGADLIFKSSTPEPLYQIQSLFIREKVLEMQRLGKEIPVAEPVMEEEEVNEYGR